MGLNDLNFQLLMLIGLAIACCVISWLIWTRIQYARSKTILVQRKSRFLSVAENQMFDCLVEALSDSYFVFAKVGVRDVVAPSPSAPAHNAKRIHQELSEHYFDFVLCSQKDMSIYGVVELEHSDKSKVTRQGKLRQNLVRRTCKSANLKLFYFDVRQDYKNMDITRLITGKPKRVNDNGDALSPTHQSQLTIDDSSYSLAGNIRSCPKCRSEVVSKVSVKGDNIGEKFLMCRKYPYCDYRLSMDELEEMNKAEQQKSSRKSKSKGFKNWSAG